MNPLVCIRDLRKKFGPLPVLRGVDLDVPAHGILGLLGPNGAGKTTLFGCLLGLVRPDTGRVAWPASEPSPAKVPPAHRVGYLPERVSLYPHLSVWQNGMFFARLKRCNAQELAGHLRHVGLDGLRRRRVAQLSKGMLQRLGLAIALCGRPDLLILDEPFSGLDPSWLDDLQEILLAEHRRGASLLIASHNIRALESLATHTAILLDGRIVGAGSLQSMRERYPLEGSLEAIYHRVASQSRRAGPPNTPQPRSTNYRGDEVQQGPITPAMAAPCRAPSQAL